MITLDISAATASLSEYARNLDKGHLTLTDANMPVAMLVPIKYVLDISNGRPLYCTKGCCLIGYTLRGKDKVHRLYRPDGTILIGRATVHCECGAGREWYEDPKR